MKRSLWGLQNYVLRKVEIWIQKLHLLGDEGEGEIMCTLIVKKKKPRLQHRQISILLDDRNQEEDDRFFFKLQ